MLDEHGKERVSIKVELKSGFDQKQIVSTLSHSLKKVFKISMDIEVVQPGTVKRFELKQKRWSDQRGAQLSQFANAALPHRLKTVLSQ